MRMTNRGYFGVGVWHAKNAENIGTLWRSAHNFGAAFIFTVGRRYKQQASDTTKAWRHVPLLHFEDIEALIAGLPFSCRLVGIELDDRAKPLAAYHHPERAVYLLGAEDHGLSEEMRRRCHDLIVIEGAERCLNVAVAGSLVMYQRACGLAQLDGRKA